MNEFQIYFRWIDDPVIVKCDDVVKYIYDNHKKDVTDLNKRNEAENDIKILRNKDKTLVYYNVYNYSVYYFDLDTAIQLSIKQENELNTSLNNELSINDITYEQFSNYITFLLDEIDIFGCDYLFIDKKIDNKWVEMEVGIRKDKSRYVRLPNE